MSTTIYVTLYNQTDEALKSDGSRTGGIGQKWHNIPESIAAGKHNQFYLTTNVREERGYAYFVVEENDQELTIYCRRGLAGNNNFYGKVNNVACKWRTKIGKDSSWGDWGQIAEGKGDMYAEVYVGPDK